MTTITTNNYMTSIGTYTKVSIGDAVEGFTDITEHTINTSNTGTSTNPYISYSQIIKLEIIVQDTPTTANKLLNNKNKGLTVNAENTARVYGEYPFEGWKSITMYRRNKQFDYYGTSYQVPEEGYIVDGVGPLQEKNIKVTNCELGSGITATITDPNLLDTTYRVANIDVEAIVANNQSYPFNSKTFGNARATASTDNIYCNEFFCQTGTENNATTTTRVAWIVPYGVNYVTDTKASYGVVNKATFGPYGLIKYIIYGNKSEHYFEPGRYSRGYDATVRSDDGLMENRPQLLIKNNWNGQWGYDQGGSVTERSTLSGADLRKAEEEYGGGIGDDTDQDYYRSIHVLKRPNDPDGRTHAIVYVGQDPSFPTTFQNDASYGNLDPIGSNENCDGTSNRKGYISRKDDDNWDFSTEEGKAAVFIIRYDNETNSLVDHYSYHNFFALQCIGTDVSGTVISDASGFFLSFDANGSFLADEDDINTFLHTNNFENSMFMLPDRLSWDYAPGVQLKQNANGESTYVTVCKAFSDTSNCVVEIAAESVRKTTYDPDEGTHTHVSFNEAFSLYWKWIPSSVDVSITACDSSGDSIANNGYTTDSSNITIYVDLSFTQVDLDDDKINRNNTFDYTNPGTNGLTCTYGDDNTEITLSSDGDPDDSKGGILTYSYTLTPSNSDTTYTIEMAADSFTDNYYNYNSDASFSFNYDITPPTITGTTLATDNSTIAVTFSEAVFNTTDGSGTLVESNFILDISGGSATVAATPSSIDISGNVYTLGLSLDGIPNGSETLEVVPSSATAIYDAAGNAASTTQNNNTVSLYDETAPSLTSVSIRSNNSNTSYAKAGNTVTLTITPSETINEPTVDFESGDNQITNFVSYSTGTGNIRTASYVVSGSDTNGLVSFTIKYTDLAFNSGVDINAVTDLTSVTIDVVDPSMEVVSIESNNDKDTSYAKAGNTVTLTMKASETINEPTVVFYSDQDTITNFNDISYSQITDGDEWTASYVVSGSDTNGLVSFTIDYQDVAGNSGQQSYAVTDLTSVTIDVVDPSMEIVSIISEDQYGNNDSLATTGDTVTLTMVASEQIYRPTVVFFSDSSSIYNSISYKDSSGVEIDNSNNTLSQSWTASFDVSGSDTDGVVSFTIDYQDIAGNSGEQSNAVTDESSVTVDTVPPTIVITATDPSGDVISSGSASNDAYLNLTFTASKELDGFDFQSVDILNDGELSNDSGGFDTSDNEIFTAQLYPSGTNTITVQVLKEAISDLFGNSNTKASNAFEWAYDGSNATVSIYDTSSNITGTSIVNTSTNVSPVNFTIEIGELDTSFNVSDIDVSNGTLDNFQDASGDDVDHSYYTVDVYPSSEGSVFIRVLGGSFEDAVGNLNNPSNEFKWTYDITPPTIEITATDLSNNDISSNETSNDAYLNLTFTASKEIEGFMFQNVDVSNGFLSSTIGDGDFDNSGNITFTAQLYPSGTNTITVQVLPDEIIDTAGNYNDTSSNAFEWAYDGSNATVSIYDTTENDDSIEGKHSNTNPVTFTIEIDELDTSFNVSDIIVTNGTLDDFQDASGDDVDHSYYSVKFYPKEQSLCTIRVLEGSFEDAAGNLNNESNTFEWTYDTTVPIMTITATNNTDNVEITSGDSFNEISILLKFTVDETTDDFDKDDILVTNGKISDFRSANSNSAYSNIYYAVFTANEEGECTIYVPANSFTDFDERSNPESNIFTWTYDITPPTISSVSGVTSTGSFKGGDRILLKVTFSEIVTLSSGDTLTLTLNNGESTTIESIDATDTVKVYYTVSYTTNLDNLKVSSISLSDGTLTDAAGNIMIVFTGYTNLTDGYVIDNTKPVITSITPSWGTILTNIETLSDGTITVIIDSIEDGQIVTIQLNNTFYIGTTSSNTAIITIPAANLQILSEITHTIIVNVNDLAGNAAEEKSTSFLCDVSLPTMIITTSTSNEIVDGKSNTSPVEFTFTSNEEIYDFTIDDIDATNGSISNFSGSGKIYTVEFTPTANGECTIKIEAGKFTDLVGNENKESNTIIWTYDNISPEVDITASEIKNGGTYNSSLTILFTINEPVLDFIIDYISVTNGTLTNLEGDDTLYTATFTPYKEGTCTINISKNQFQDIYGNVNIAATEFIWTYDVTPPDTPTITFKESNTSFNYSYPIGSSVIYYKNNARGSTSKYYNNILSISFASDVYKWDYSVNGGNTYTTIFGNTDNSITLTNGTYNPGTIIIRNYDEATNVSSVTNTNQIIITYNLSGNTINNENMSTKLKIAQAIRLANK